MLFNGHIFGGFQVSTTGGFLAGVLQTVELQKRVNKERIQKDKDIAIMTLYNMKFDNSN